MNNKRNDSSPRRPAALTIAGSDSGGGAGIQADLQTMAAFNVFGVCAITCLTAQNPREVTTVFPIPPDTVAEQINAVCRAFPLAAAKTGMLYSVPIIEAVAQAVREWRIAPLVADPVMVATSGARLLQEDAVAALRETLLPLARVITPNIPEAEMLSSLPIRTSQQQKEAAARIGRAFGCACVVKGGHAEGDMVEDVLWEDGRWTVFPARRVAARETHGTGCTFSAAIAAALAQGRVLTEAVAMAQEHVRLALVHATAVGPHHPLRFYPPKP